MSPVITLLKTLPRARNEAASTAPVVSVSTTTSESLMDTCERVMPDHNLRAGRRRRCRGRLVGRNHVDWFRIARRTGNRATGAGGPRRRVRMGRGVRPRACLRRGRVEPAGRDGRPHAADPPGYPAYSTAVAPAVEGGQPGGHGGPAFRWPGDPFGWRRR